MSENIAIDVYDDEQLTSEQREDAIRSVRTMAAPAIESRNGYLETEAAATELSNAINRPLLDLVERDDKARHAAEGAVPLLKVEPDFHIDWLDSPVGSTEPPSVTGRSFFAPPFHFGWAWHRIDGGAPEAVIVDRPSGTVIFDGRSGPLAPNGRNKFVEIHAGFGVGFRPDRDGVLTATSDRRFMKFYYGVAAHGIGSWAVAEGGTECSIMSEGNWKAGESRKKFRKRVSVNERETFESNLFGDGVMRHMVPVRAGHDYQFNVGAWLFVDNTSGVGQSGALAQVRCEVPVMELTGP
ncbi:hypothetical protein ACFV20_03340 [Streptomyces sp. NPDC059696]|uniref:hypothetical protein n=1 Tax=Streptomyces sp. NPDC059696 TaxID=3346911 RepID=UPI0036D12B18